MTVADRGQSTANRDFRSLQGVGTPSPLFRVRGSCCRWLMAEPAGSVVEVGRSRGVVLSFLYWMLRRLLELLVLRVRSQRAKEIETPRSEIAAPPPAARVGRLRSKTTTPRTDSAKTAGRAGDSTDQNQANRPRTELTHPTGSREPPNRLAAEKLQASAGREAKQRRGEPSPSTATQRRREIIGQRTRTRSNRFRCSPLCQVAAQMLAAIGGGFPWKSATTEFTNPTGSGSASRPRRSRPCYAPPVSGRRRGGSAPAGPSSCAPRRTVCSAAICVRQRQTGSGATRPGGASQLRMGRPTRSTSTTSLLTAPPTNLRLISEPLRMRRGSVRLCVLSPTRPPARAPPSHRSPARDGPQERAGACLPVHCPVAPTKPEPVGSRARAHRASDPLERREAHRNFCPGASPHPTDHHQPEVQA
jgi:hypothetical protein